MLQVVYFQILGYPLIMWLGVIGFLAMIGTVSIPYLRNKGYKIRFVWHIRLAWVAVGIAVIHAILGMLIYI